KKKKKRKLNSAIISFTWHKKRPRLRYSFLSLPRSRGGLAAPSLKNYQLAAQLKYILEWFIDDPKSIWLSCESLSLGTIPLRNLLYISPEKAAALTKDNIILRNMLVAWQQIRRWEGHENCLSLLTPLHENPDFLPGLQAGLATWKSKGIIVVGDLMQDGVVLSFQQIKDKF
ncbi:hypothetical protein LDENG_00020070, partial [Lucifuga dentata]